AVGRAVVEVEEELVEALALELVAEVHAVVVPGRVGGQVDAAVAGLRGVGVARAPDVRLEVEVVHDAGRVVEARVEARLHRGAADPRALRGGGAEVLAEDEVLAVVRGVVLDVDVGAVGAVLVAHVVEGGGERGAGRGGRAALVDDVGLVEDEVPGGDGGLEAARAGLVDALVAAVAVAKLEAGVEEGVPGLDEAGGLAVHGEDGGEALVGEVRVLPVALGGGRVGREAEGARGADAVGAAEVLAVGVVDGGEGERHAVEGAGEGEEARRHAHGARAGGRVQVDVRGVDQVDGGGGRVGVAAAVAVDAVEVHDVVGDGEGGARAVVQLEVEDEEATHGAHDNAGVAGDRLAGEGQDDEVVGPAGGVVGGDGGEGSEGGQKGRGQKGGERARAGRA